MIKIAALGAGSALLNPGIQIAGAEEACSSEGRIALLASSLRAGLSAKTLKEAAGGNAVVDYSSLQPATFSTQWAESSFSYINSIVSAIPQSLSDSDDGLCDAQATAIAYAVDRAQWSVGSNRASDLGSESVYMYLSHYIDVGSNYWNAGGLEYLTSGSSRSDVQPYYAQWLQASDRSSYQTYLRATSGTAKIGEIASVATGLLSGGSFLANDAQQAVRSLVLSTNANEAACTVLGLMAETELLESAFADLINLASDFPSMLSSNPDAEMEQLATSFKSEAELSAGYSDTAKELLLNAAIAVGGAFFLSGGLVGVLGTAAMSAVSSATIMSAYMASDFFSRTAWLVMRYGWSGRYAERLSERLYS